MDAKRILVYIRQSVRRVVAFLRSKNVMTFLFFLVLAFVLWLMHGSSSSGRIHGTIKVVYEGLPANIKLDKPLPAEIKFEIRDELSRNMWYLFYDLDVLHVNVSDKIDEVHHKIDIDYSEQLLRMFRSSGKDVRINEISPAYYESEYLTLSQKRVPIRFTGNLTLGQGYVQSDSLTITPSHTVICGEPEMLEMIDFLAIPRNFSNITRSLDVNVAVDHSSQIIVTDSVVHLSVPVEMSTEKQLVVPVSALNVPYGVSVRTFPAEVTVRFSVGLSRYKSVNEDDFVVVFDYDEVRASGRFSAPLRVVDLPANLHNVRITPSEVEFVVVEE